MSHIKISDVKRNETTFTPMRTIYTTLILLFIIAIANGQHKHCATDHELLIDRVDANRKYAEEHQVEMRGIDTRYIPIKFHLVGRTDGTGRLRFSSLLDNLCRFNRDFSKLDMIGYINEGVNNYNNTGVFEQPQSSSSVFKMRSQFDDESMNVFIVDSADDGTGQGITLGYYSPSDDFIVLRQEEFIDSTVSFTHEAGHFLSLMHPFFGWEVDPYNPAKHGNPLDVFFTGGGFNACIEVVDGSNCTQCGDRICDTPPAYHFSFGSGISVAPCELVSEVYDSNVDLVDPMENNVMDYFSDCTVYDFTPDQASVMQADFDSPSRNYIRSSYVPNTAQIEQEAEIIYPTTGTVVEAYNSVFFDWTDVEHADTYLVEVQDVFGGTITEYFTSESYLWLTDLEADTKYAYFVHPFNETNACFKTNKVIFDTGSGLTSVHEIRNLETFEIFPNPISDQGDITIGLSTLTSLDATIQISSANGSKVYSQFISGIKGKTQFTIPSPVAAGMYFISIITNEGSTTRRIIKQ